MLKMFFFVCVCLLGFVLNIFVLFITNNVAYFNDSISEGWGAADSAQMINAQMKETPQPFG